MKEALTISYYDRQTRNLLEEPVFASSFLDWSYNTRPGRWSTDLLFCRRSVSRFYGWLHRQRWSKRKIGPFAAALGVNVQECIRPLEAFASFNEFFTREIDLSKRPIHPDPRVCIAPADGKLLAFPVVDGRGTFHIKRSSFTLPRLLGDEALAARFAGGSLAILRLHLSDYHHVHFPDSGTAGDAHAIGGKLYAVSPYSKRRPVPFYTENYRMRTLLASDHFGLIGIVEIGAFTVGSIRQRYRPGERVAKGERKGSFELGGSTVVLAFAPGAIRLDQDLCDNTAQGFETHIRLGESIGRAQ